MNRRFLYICILLILMTLFVASQGYSRTLAAPSIQGLHVSGNAIMNGDNQPIRLLGVNRSGAEFACVQDKGIWDGPTDDDSIKAMLIWHINTVRVPLNEDCWLDINDINGLYGGAIYQSAITKFVKLLNSNGLIVILDLHWNAPGKDPADKQQAMPDEDHAPDFWKSVATAFKDNSSVIFDLYNEPYPDRMTNSNDAWKCWQSGGDCNGIAYKVAGMQELINTVRSTGATNIVMLGGLAYSNSMSQWLTHKPTDPTGNLAASWHVYSFNSCADSACWDSDLAPIIQQVPLIAGEIGQTGCTHEFIDKVMDWLDAHQASYLGWTWNTWDCAQGPALITDYRGSPTGYGQGLKDRLTKLSQEQAGTSAPTAVGTAE